MREAKPKGKKRARWLNILQPQLHIGGIDISDQSLAFLRIDQKNGSWERASVRLEEAVVENGKILQREKFIKSIQELRQKITHKKKETIPVVVSISDENVYTQRFSLPPLKRAEFDEAVKLNLQTISPSDSSTMYYDWERIGQEEESGEAEILASFIEKKVIDELVKVFADERFFITAVEQKAASTVRTIRHLEKTFDSAKSYLLVMDAADGISFVIVRKGMAYFGRFSDWNSVEGDLRNFIVREYHQISNFFTNKFHEQFECAYMALQNSSEEIAKIVQENFTVPVRQVRLPAGQAGAWLVALGAALRGVAPRSQDTQISLAPEGTELLYQQMLTSSFLSLWTGIFSGAAVIILAAFLGVFVFLNTHVQNTAETVISSFNDPQILAQYEFYTKEAGIFNASITKALEIKNQQVKWGTFMRDIFDRTGSSVVISRIYMQARNMPVTVTGTAATESEVSAFRDRLAQLPYVTEIDLPLSSFQRVDATHISFRLMFKFKNLDF
ncbi:hypothetical protein A2755_02525 [Candidatus Wolfebacteria bacterium RIFCSPHIGHO2_01_FULL_48_22]|uniref:SHS2 domain-containing protein n=2 Tax=Candidatus Wolfeibacteriota TaxID=1752735 RepID=A0A1F8DRJ3_9BACT|nr:MAG: hypothetical protein A2755_02525 [Candidatus Wolfebacteria bacterium RIFCSPHIGHO2_01_FULL_48_22]OGM92248.1 MAG: hypothetical protein A2935_00545 [Candidatus Wolfebacteria bacterium RIFCSPLOWO2_01_FULL_47_17b]